MRLVILKFAYPHYLNSWYADGPQATDRSYEDQRAALENDAFWWGGSWSRALADLGVEVTEIIQNAEPLQRAWAREHAVVATRFDWMKEVVGRQIAAVRPDALFIQSFRGLSPAGLARIRAENPTLKAVVGWVGSPLVPPRLLEMCDHVLTCVPEVVDELGATGLSCSHMDHAFDPAVLDRVAEPTGRDIGFSFVGGVLDRLQHGPRADLIREVSARTELQLFAHVPRTSTTRRGVLETRLAYAVAAGLCRAGVARPTLLSIPIPMLRNAAMKRSAPRLMRPLVPAARMHGPVYGLRMFETLARSRVTLNVHSTVSSQSASNLRMFEATGVGTCLLTDWRPNIGDLFEPEREVVTYRSAAECAERAEWLCDNPAEAERIAAAGRRRTLAEHTFAHRAPVLDATIRAVLANGTRP